MKIKIVFGSNVMLLEEEMNTFLKDCTEEGFMIIDYGVETRKDGGLYGYIKYCEKEFLRNYKIDSLMSEKD